MSRISTVVPVIAGAAAGAVVALAIAGTGGSKSVTTTVLSPSSTSAAATSTQSASNQTSSSTSGSGSGTVPTSLGNGKNGLTINEIYRSDSPGVVDITVDAVQSSGQGPFSQSQETEDEGAGVVYDSKGDIVTDEHVVAGATAIEVHFQNGVNAKAKLLGEDASTDVAVIKVDVPTSELHRIPFANSDEAQVGDPVVAIGSPFSLPETTTAGIVSAVGRSITAPNNYTITGAIQTDAAINPGNSGGPLLDAAGQVLGLNDQIQTSSGDSAGVGFATPGNTDVKVANTIIGGKKVQHAYVGVCLNETSASGAQIASSSSYNCSTPVVAGSPASKAGLQPGDTVTSVNGQKISSSNDFIEVLGNYSPGQTVKMTVTGPGGNRIVKVTLANRPAATAGGG
jgi:S1-C subfamily serine protease